MAKKLIPPRRDEAFSNRGLGTVRMLEYLEENAKQTNDTTDNVEADLSSINLSVGQSAQLTKQIASIVNEALSSQAALISRLNKRIEQLESTVSPQPQEDKRFSQLENDLVAPIHKTRYDKLTIKNAFINTLTVIDTINTVSGSWGLGGIDLNTGKTYKINNINVLTATDLGLGVVNSKLTNLGVLTTLDNSGEYKVNNVKVVGARESAISDPLATVNSLQIAVINILNALRPVGHGLIDV